MLKITSGMIKAFIECPQKYNLIYNNHIEIPSKNIESEIGKKIHALINYKYKNFAIDKITKNLIKPTNIEIKKLWDNFLTLNINKVEESEYTFDIQLETEIRLTGRIDALKKENEKYEILDWKTGKSENLSPENDFQTIVYLYSIYELLKTYKNFTKHENLSITYYFLKENTSKTVTFSKEKYEQYKKELQKICQEIKNSRGKYKKNQKKCSKCIYNIICQATYEI